MVDTHPNSKRMVLVVVAVIAAMVILSMPGVLDRVDRVTQITNSDGVKQTDQKIFGLIPYSKIEKAPHRDIRASNLAELRRTGIPDPASFGILLVQPEAFQTTREKEVSYFIAGETVASPEKLHAFYDRFVTGKTLPAGPPGTKSSNRIGIAPDGKTPAAISTLVGPAYGKLTRFTLEVTVPRPFKSHF
jgi:hypothetical protein